jgi:sugar phosphate isomerase/epimerase
MVIGAMNHPGRDILGELEWINELGFDFIDLTLEPPMAAPSKVNTLEVRSRLEAIGLGIVGHTAYYMPICSPFESLRRAAVDELKRCVDVFSRLGAKWMNLHPDSHAPFHVRAQMVEQNIKSIREIAAVTSAAGIGLMVENLPGSFNTADQMAELLGEIPELGLHLDIGHANLLVERNTTAALLQAFAPRLKHVHLHDNKGGSQDLHLPLGAGTLEVPTHVQQLRAHGYDGTITLEVFSADRRLLNYSREVLRELWDGSASPAGVSSGRFGTSTAAG